METTQVTLRLIDKKYSFHDVDHDETVSGDKILAQMKKNGVFKNDKDGIYAPVLFNGQSFMFREGKTITVDKTIAKALQRSAHIIVGAKAINSPSCPFLEVVKEFALGEQVAPRPQFACSLCDKDCETPGRLARHMMKIHKDVVNEPAVDWEEEDKPVAAGVEEE